MRIPFFLMHTFPRLRNSLFLFFAFLLFAPFWTTQGQTFETIATGKISSKMNTGYNAIDLKTRDTVLNPTDTNVLWVDQDVNFTLGGAEATWESATWFPVDGIRRAASMLGSDEVGTPVAGRQINLRNLTLTKTDMDTQNVLIKFQPGSGSASLTLNDSSLTGQMLPSLTSSIPFALNTTGTSEINSWQGQLFATTTLTVSGTFTWKNCGDVTPALPSDRLYFHEENNVATVNGSLIVADSNVLFGKVPADPANDSTITVNSGGSMSMTGFDSRFETDNVVINGGSLALALNTYVTARNTLTLTNATVSANDGSLLNSEVLLANGTSTVTVSSSLSVSNPEVVTTGILQVNKDAVLNVTSSDGGSMGITDQVLYDTTGGTAMGQIHVKGNASLVVSGLGDFNVSNGGVLTTERTSPTVFGIVFIGNNATMELNATSQFTNNGLLDVDAGGTVTISGATTIGGTGDISLGFLSASTLAFDSSTPAQNSLTTNNTLSFDSSSILEMTLNPTAAICDKIIIGGTLDIHSSTVLSLSVVNDTALSLGTKFLLIDYADAQIGTLGNFHNFANGTSFSLGLNTFQILYADPDYQVGQSSFVTLTTVVPEPSTTALLAFASLLLTRHARRRKKI